MDHSGTGWGALYAEHVDDLAALATSLGDDDLTRTVPGCPAWTVHDVYAHLAGGPADAVIGRVDGAPGPEWTARHVAERQAVPLVDLVAEMRANTEHVAASVAGVRTPGTVWDIAVHHADLHEALGKHQLAERLWEPVLAQLAPRVLTGLPITLVAGATTYGAGGDRAEVAPYELFRALFSRRSRRQVAAWGGAVLSPEQLDGICVFGPRDDDQPTPADPAGPA